MTLHSFYCLYDIPLLLTLYNNFSHDRSNWPCSSFSSTTFQNFWRQILTFFPKYPSIILIFVLHFEASNWVPSLCHSKYICHPSTSTVANAQSSPRSPCHVALGNAANAHGTHSFFHYVEVLLLMPKSLPSSFLVFFYCRIFCLVLGFISFLFSFCYLLPLKFKYLPQHPILKHPQPMFLHQCERPSFTLTYHYRQTYSSVHLNLHIFG